MKTLTTPRQSVIHISDAVYEKIAEKLKANIGGKEYYKGQVECEDGALFSQLETTIIAYYRKEVAPDGVRDELSDVVSIWYEFHAWLDGEDNESSSDFEFPKLKQYLTT